MRVHDIQAMGFPDTRGSGACPAAGLLPTLIPGIGTPPTGRTFRFPGSAPNTKNLLTARSAQHDARVPEAMSPELPSLSKYFVPTGKVPVPHETWCG